MKSRTKTFVSVLLLIVYGTLTFVAVPLHHHDDSFFTTGNGKHAIAQHDDALHCRHRVIESHDDCTICSFVSQSAISKVVAVIPQVNIKSVEYVSSFYRTVIQDVYSSHSHRGPPVNFV